MTDAMIQRLRNAALSRSDVEAIAFDVGAAPETVKQTTDTVEALCQLLGDPDIVRAPRAHLVVDAAFSLSAALTEEHKKSIVSAVSRHYARFGPVALCIKAADYCLRAQTREDALKSLSQLNEMDLSDPQVYGVIEAVEALHKQNNDYPHIQAQCLATLRKLRPVRIVGDGA